MVVNIEDNGNLVRIRRDVRNRWRECVDYFLNFGDSK